MNRPIPDQGPPSRDRSHPTPHQSQISHPKSVREFYRTRFGSPPTHLVQVPLACTLLGSDTEPHEGLALSVAIDRYVTLAASPRADGKIQLVSMASAIEDLFWMSDLRLNPRTPWADLVKAVLLQLRKKQIHFSGFTAAIQGFPAPESPADPSAALAVATALTIRQLHPFSLNELGAGVPPRRDDRGRLPPCSSKERPLLARLCHFAPQQIQRPPLSFVATASVLAARAWQVLSLDCRFQTLDWAPLVGLALVRCDPGPPTSPLPDDSTEFHHLCRTAANALRAKSLRSVEPAFLKANQARLSPREFECAYHVVGEIQRVVYAERALRQEDHRQFGHFLTQSHESRRDFRKESCPEADQLVQSAQSHPGCLGTRWLAKPDSTHTLSLVDYHQVLDFLDFMAKHHRQTTGRPLRTEVYQIVAGP